MFALHAVTYCIGRRACTSVLGHEMELLMWWLTSWGGKRGRHCDRAHGMKQSCLMQKKKLESHRLISLQIKQFIGKLIHRLDDNVLKWLFQFVYLTETTNEMFAEPTKTRLLYLDLCHRWVLVLQEALVEPWYRCHTTLGRMFGRLS